MMRIVRTRSIPNVTTERLLDDARRLCELIHPGSAFDGSRREMINHGMKLVKIHRELHRREVPFHCCGRYLAPNDHREEVKK